MYQPCHDSTFFFPRSAFSPHPPKPIRTGIFPPRPPAAACRAKSCHGARPGRHDEEYSNPESPLGSTSPRKGFCWFLFLSARAPWSMTRVQFLFRFFFFSEKGPGQVMCAAARPGWPFAPNPKRTFFTGIAWDA